MDQNPKLKQAYQSSFKLFALTCLLTSLNQIGTQTGSHPGAWAAESSVAPPQSSASRPRTIGLPDVGMILEPLRNQIMSLMRIHEQTPTGTALQSWLTQSRTVIDYDASKNHALVQIYSSGPMPVIQFSSKNGAEARPHELQGFKGIQFFANGAVVNAIRAAKERETLNGETPQSILQFSDALRQRLSTHSGIAGVNSLQEIGFGMMFTRALNQINPQAERESPSVGCTPGNAGRAWQLDGRDCFVIDDTTAIVPCVFEARENSEVVLSSSGNWHELRTDNPHSHPMSFADVTCELGGFDIAARYVFSLQKDTSVDPQAVLHACALGDPGCNAQEVMGSSWNDLNVNRPVRPPSRH